MRFSYIFLILVASLSFVGAAEPVVNTADQIAKLEREIIDFKMSRADSWMFFLSAFMTLVAVMVAIFAFITYAQINNLKREAEELRDKAKQAADNASSLTSDIRKHHVEVLGSAASAATTKENLGVNVGHNQRPTLAVTPEVDQLIAEAEDLLAAQKVSDAIEKWHSVAQLTEITNPDIYADALVQISSLLTQCRDFEASLEAAKKAIEADDKSAEAWLNLGWAKINLNMNAQALRDLEHAATLRPDIPMVWNNIGLAKCNLGRYAESIPDFDKAISLNSEFALAWNNKGWARLNMNHFREAVSDLKIALQCEPFNFLSVGNLSLAYRLLGRFEDALQLTTEAIEHNPEDCASLNNRARTYLEMRNFDEARKDLDAAKVLAEKQSNIDVLMALKQNYEELEKLENFQR